MGSFLIPGSNKYLSVSDAAGTSDDPLTLNAVVSDFEFTGDLEVDTDQLETNVGAVNEAAAASDTASSGLNGRLQRIAQRLTSLIGLIPAALSSGGGLKVGVVDTVTTSRKSAYDASSNLTITLASLASDTNLLAGREATLVDNTTNKYTDYFISGKVTAGTSPTASRVIEIHALAMMDDSTWPDSFTGADAAKTITSANIKNSICRLVASMDTSNTSDRTYYFGPVSLRALFGFCPAKFLVWVVHNTGVNLNATGGNHQITVKGIYETLG